MISKIFFKKEQEGSFSVNQVQEKMVSGKVGRWRSRRKKEKKREQQEEKVSR